MNWKMRFCADSFGPLPIVEKVFDTVEDGIAFLEQEALDLLAPRVWKLDTDDFRQFGTNNRWASFERTP